MCASYNNGLDCSSHQFEFVKDLWYYIFMNVQQCSSSTTFQYYGNVYDPRRADDAGVYAEDYDFSRTLTGITNWGGLLSGFRVTVGSIKGASYFRANIENFIFFWGNYYPSRNAYVRHFRYGWESKLFL
mgnify:FL=1